MANLEGELMARVLESRVALLKARGRRIRRETKVLELQNYIQILKARIELEQFTEVSQGQACCGGKEGE